MKTVDLWMKTGDLWMKNSGFVDEKQGICG